MNIIVLAGGFSSEREVSLVSGSLVANALIQNGHRVLLLDPYLGCEPIPADPMSLFQTDAVEVGTVGTVRPIWKRSESKRVTVRSSARMWSACANGRTRSSSHSTEGQGKTANCRRSSIAMVFHTRDRATREVCWPWIRI